MFDISEEELRDSALEEISSNSDNDIDLHGGTVVSVLVFNLQCI